MTVADRAPSWVRFVRAAEWGINWQNPPRPERLGDPETFVHHTAGNPMSTIDAVAAMRRLESISHRLGYSTVAYDVVTHLHEPSGTLTVLGGRAGDGLFPSRSFTVGPPARPRG